ncbi:MAG TPA: M20/M25/M40 family metallo-hydrolase [Solirubrobacteraceae bacterium]|jgi:glutamate carboxypeptidase|nr:M20/M25/M40 family metallo-hydrolase [Solirubrobacteraceae bacterium]
MGQDFAALAAEAAPRVLDEMRQLVAISTPSGEIEGTEHAILLCQGFLPGWRIERLPCSTSRCAPDMLATLTGTGSRRMLLLGHLDTVVPHGEHQATREEGDRLYGSGTADMKGGVAISLAVARACAAFSDEFAELAVLLVSDEEWRIAPFAHVERFVAYDACLCFEAGEISEDGDEGVIVRRKGAGTLRVRATGRASHSGSAPQNGRNALLALAHVAIEVTAAADPEGETQLTVVPTVVRSGEAFNVVPASGELLFDTRASDTDAFARVLAAVPTEVGGATLEPVMERVWPAMDSEASSAPLLAAAAQLLGRPIVPRARGGASDASHFAPTVPLTIDGLGPRGGGAHTPEEFVHLASLPDRIAVALSVARAAILSE